jgi:Mlc titration factor MtfA (ptsG expression regulator)
MMFKWPWKVDEESGNAEIPWEKALAIPVLANLSDHEQQQLAQMASAFATKRLVALQGLELTPLQSARIALLFCLPVLELGIEWLDGFTRCLSTLPRSLSTMNGKMISAWCIAKSCNQGKAGSKGHCSKLAGYSGLLRCFRFQSDYSRSGT